MLQTNMFIVCVKLRKRFLLVVCLWYTDITLLFYPINRKRPHDYWKWLPRRKPSPCHSSRICYDLKNRILKIRMMKMYMVWSNRRNTHSFIPRFPKIIPRTACITQVYVPDPFFPYGYRPTPHNDASTSCDIRPLAYLLWAAPVFIIAVPVYTMLQPRIQRPNKNHYPLGTTHVTWDDLYGP